VVGATEYHLSCGSSGSKEGGEACSERHCWVVLHPPAWNDFAAAGNGFAAHGMRGGGWEEGGDSPVAFLLWGKDFH